MLRRQSRWTASKTTSHSESQRGVGQNQPPLMRTRLATAALSCVVHSPLTQSIQETSNHVLAPLLLSPIILSLVFCKYYKVCLGLSKTFSRVSSWREREWERLLWSGVLGEQGGVGQQGQVWWQTRKHCLPVLLLWEHFPAPSSCGKHYLALPFVGHALMCQWPRKADNHWRAREWWAPTLPLQPINPTQTSVYPHR